MPDPNAAPAGPERVRAAHAEEFARLVGATLAALDAAAPLAPDASPRSFEALKAEHRR